MNQDTEKPLEARKGKNMDSTLEPPKRNAVLLTPSLPPIKTHFALVTFRTLINPGFLKSLIRSPMWCQQQLDTNIALTVHTTAQPRLLRTPVPSTILSALRVLTPNPPANTTRKLQPLVPFHKPKNRDWKGWTAQEDTAFFVKSAFKHREPDYRALLLTKKRDQWISMFHVYTNRKAWQSRFPGLATSRSGVGTHLDAADAETAERPWYNTGPLCLSWPHRLYTACPMPSYLGSGEERASAKC